MKKFLVIAALLFLGAGCGVPKSAKIAVPFTPQAPQGDWSQPWQDACEETSIYMVSSFYADDPIRREEAVKRIREILKVKNETIKVSLDESLETIAKLIDELGMPWTTELKVDPTAEDLKRELAAGRPIIVPVYAPALRNPYYTADYHVLVLTGYDDEKDDFIVNDPGTRSGEGLRFPQDVFMAAIHDLNPRDKDAGRKAVLFTRQNDWREWFEGLGSGP
ncbi:MAG TPA: C39 family peptidase [Candidatus Baltobacteraceae bacterium]|nr:C39 family peptidase [Candidatus Baltobacteraceae bacterium]